MGDHTIKDLLTHFDDLYLARWGFKYLFSGKDAKLMKDLLAVYAPDDIKAFLTAFFASHDEFIQQSGYSLSVFRGCLPKVIAAMEKDKPRERRCQYGHTPACRNSSECTLRFLNEERAKRGVEPLRAMN